MPLRVALIVVRRGAEILQSLGPGSLVHGLRHKHRIDSATEMTEQLLA